MEDLTRATVGDRVLFIDDGGLVGGRVVVDDLYGLAIKGDAGGIHSGNEEFWSEVWPMPSLHELQLLDALSRIVDWRQ